MTAAPLRLRCERMSRERGARGPGPSAGARPGPRARAPRYTGLDCVPPDLAAQRAGKVLKWLRFKIREFLFQAL